MEAQPFYSHTLKILLNTLSVCVCDLFFVFVCGVHVAAACTCFCTDL